MAAMTDREVTRAIVFLESRITGYESLIAGLGPGTEWFLVDTTEDGFVQIQRDLVGYTDFDATFIISHGEPRTLCLGNTTQISDIIQNYKTDLERIGASLSSEGDILLYGCDVVSSDAVKDFVQDLAATTGADVAASNDFSVLSGDADLELSTRTITTETLTGFPTISGLSGKSEPNGTTSTASTISAWAQ